MWIRWKISIQQDWWSIPDFIAVCVPLILGTFKKPAEQPITAPPGKAGYGIDWNLTSIHLYTYTSKRWEKKKKLVHNADLCTVMLFMHPYGQSYSDTYTSFISNARKTSFKENGLYSDLFCLWGLQMEHRMTSLSKLFSGQHSKITLA